MTAVADLPARFLAAVEAGDMDALQRLYAPHARIWHNTDGAAFAGQTVEENLRTLRWMRRVLTAILYEEVRIATTPTGYAQQHVLRATTSLGEPFRNAGVHPLYCGGGPHRPPGGVPRLRRPCAAPARCRSGP